MVSGRKKRGRGAGKKKGSERKERIANVIAIKKYLIKIKRNQRERKKATTTTTTTTHEENPHKQKHTRMSRRKQGPWRCIRCNFMFTPFNNKKIQHLHICR